MLWQLRFLSCKKLRWKCQGVVQGPKTKHEHKPDNSIGDRNFFHLFLITLSYPCMQTQRLVPAEPVIRIGEWAEVEIFFCSNSWKEAKKAPVALNQTGFYLCVCRSISGSDLSNEFWQNRVFRNGLQWLNRRHWFVVRQSGHKWPKRGRHVNAQIGNPML
jgi:hypothetical protein